MNALSPTTLLATTSLTSTTSDAELLRLDSLMFDLVKRENVAWEGVDEDDTPEHAAAVALTTEVSEVSNRISQAPASTIQGVLVKMRAILWCHTGDYFDPRDLEACAGHTPSLQAHLLASMLNSLAALSAWPEMFAGTRLIGMGTDEHAPADAELISACAEYQRLEHEFEVYSASQSGGASDDDLAMAKLLKDERPVIDRICTLTATTDDGHRARAAALFTAGGELVMTPDDPEDGRLERMSAALVRDLVRGCSADVAIPLLPSPDSDLLAAVDAFTAARARRPVSVGPEKVFGTPECERYEALLASCFTVESDLFRAALALPASTVSGLRAKARLIKTWNEHQEHVDALLDDLLREPSA